MRIIIFGVVLFAAAYISYTVNPSLFALLKEPRSLIKLTFFLGIILVAFRKKTTIDEGE